VSGGLVRAVVLCGALVAAARAAPETKRFESSDHRVAIDLPADWTLAPAQSEHAVVSVQAAVPPSGAAVQLDLFHQRGMLDPRFQAYVDRDLRREQFDAAERGAVGLEPLPHLTMNVKREGVPAWNAWIYRVVNRNGFTLAVQCEAETWPLVKDACFAAAATITTTHAAWPEAPEGYASSERDGYEYLLQPGVSEEDVLRLHAALLDLEKRYAKAHGPVPKPRDRRPVVLLSVDAAAAASAAGTAKAREAYVTSESQGRLHAVPLPKDDPTAAAQLASAATELFHAQCFGPMASPWLASAEKRLAAAESRLGRPPGAIPDCFKGVALPKAMRPLVEVVKSPGADAAEQATVYVELFRVGTKPWRDAFAAFLKELAATGDWEAAEAKHLLSLDQAKLLAEAQKLLKQVRPPEAK
jgi:hypothetical protein